MKLMFELGNGVQRADTLRNMVYLHDLIKYMLGLTRRDSAVIEHGGRYCDKYAFTKKGFPCFGPW